MHRKVARMVEPTSPLTRQQAALLIGVSLRKLDSLLAGRHISYFKVGKTVRISREALHRFLESSTVAAVR